MANGFPFFPGRGHAWGSLAVQDRKAWPVPTCWELSRGLQYLCNQCLAFNERPWIHHQKPWYVHQPFICVNLGPWNCSNLKITTLPRCEKILRQVDACVALGHQVCYAGFITLFSAWCLVSQPPPHLVTIKLLLINQTKLTTNKRCNELFQADYNPFLGNRPVRVSTQRSIKFSVANSRRNTLRNKQPPQNRTGKQA